MRKKATPILVAASIIILNILDAIFSVWLVKNFLAVEANPIADYFIADLGYFFVFPKICLSFVLSIMVVNHWEKSKVARTGGSFVLFVYTMLAG